MKQALLDFNNEIARRMSQPKAKGVYIREQELAKEICDYLGSNKEFGLWVKLAKQNSYDAVKAILEAMRSKGIKNSRYLLACFRKK